MEDKNNSKARRAKVFILLLLDIFVIQIASFLAIYTRFDFSFSKMDTKYLENIMRIDFFQTLLILLLFSVCRLYAGVWRYASIEELLNILIACILVCMIDICGMYFFHIDLPRSFPPLFTMYLAIGTFCIRFSYRFFRLLFAKMPDEKATRVMIVGAGAAGQMILKEIKSSHYLSYNICCLIDDNPGKAGKYLLGVQIAGGRDTIEENVQKFGIDEIMIAIPSLHEKERRSLIDLCTRTGCRVKILPGIYQIVNGDVSVSNLKEVDIEDLLGRQSVKIDCQKISGYVEDRVVLVTGGGGSIGSELCRQIAKNNPAQLIIVDIYENNAYDIQQELRKRFPYLNLVVLIASVRNTGRMEDIFERYHPDIVYHAAAHKHVPLMEESPNEAIKNNVFGTYKVAMAAGKYHTSKFVLISTDKAVNPTNIMGASKRICEMIIQMMNRQFEGTDFVAVRFGNVLGSNGSVIPLFKKQIAAGGPVTVTDPNIIRYFMTIPEAVSLVLEAGAYAKGGEIFVLDMGEPVKILDLAKNLIRLSGFREDEIAIEFTGLRPGEKLYEELLMDEEGLEDTENSLIHIGKPIEFDEEEFREKLEKLNAASKSDAADIRELVKEIVPTYVVQRTVR